MYKVIGSDNREYGPASEDILRRWIAEGRANGATQVQKEGDSGWRPISSLPEFAAALAAGAQPPPASAASAPTPEPAAPASGPAPETPAPDPGPSAAAAAAAALEAELLPREANLDIGACVQKSWELFQKNPWIVVAAWAVAFFVSFGIGIIPYIGIPGTLVLGAVLLAGLHNFFLRLSRGESASVADVFSGFGPAIGPLILGGVVSGLLIWFGLFLCLIPGLYLMLCWHFAPLLILDKHLEFWPAMELARKVVTKNFWPMLGLAIVAVLLFAVGVLGCGFLVFVTGPIATGALVEAYRRLFETQAPGASLAQSPGASLAQSPVEPLTPSPGAPPA
jgi:hypothetical protein